MQLHLAYGKSELWAIYLFMNHFVHEVNIRTKNILNIDKVKNTSKYLVYFFH